MLTSPPTWLMIARRYEGTQEIAGPATSPVILRWLNGLGAWWRDDETPWCGTFVAHCLQEAAQPIPKLWMRAKSWADYGALLRRDRLAQGAILVFDRQGGGHVGFYVGEDANYYFVLGGNQSNGVNVSKIAKSRCVASRWPRGVPVLGGPVAMSGGKVSRSEV